MSEPRSPEPRPYHHGDLRRALVEAASRLLETEGPTALSLRAVAREAGVSPAAPYHHFKDKGELMDAVAHTGWARMSEVMGEALEGPYTDDRLTRIVLAYVTFARRHPALYRVMYEAARAKEELPMPEHAPGGFAYDHVRARLLREGQEATPQDVALAIAATWCTAHGLSEMANFQPFNPLKTALGGEMPFLEAVLHHMGVYRVEPKA